MDSTHWNTFTIQIPCVCLWQYTTLKTKFHHKQKMFHFKSTTNFQKYHLGQQEGEKCSHMHGVSCSYLLQSMKNILTRAAPASQVHVYTIQSKHLLEETHSPTYTVNFCKYYKGNSVTVWQMSCQVSKRNQWTDCCFWLHIL